MIRRLIAPPSVSQLLGALFATLGLGLCAVVWHTYQEWGPNALDPGFGGHCGSFCRTAVDYYVPLIGAGLLAAGAGLALFVAASLRRRGGGVAVAIIGAIVLLAAGWFVYARYVRDNPCGWANDYGAVDPQCLPDELSVVR